MVYRDADLDARSADLVAVAATYAPLLEDQRRVRREHEELAAHVAELGRRLAALERAIEHGGVLATVKQWMGVSSTGTPQLEAAALRAELATHGERLAQLTSREGTIAARLTTVEAARAELARLDEARAEAVRAVEGPDGVELRRIDEAAAATDARIDAIARAHAAADRARQAITGSRGVLATIAQGVPLAELERSRARLREDLGCARDELRQFADALAVLQLTIEPQARFALAELAAMIAPPIAEPPEHSELVASLDSAAACTARLIAMVRGALTEQRHRRKTLTDQQRALQQSGPIARVLDDPTEPRGR